MVPAFGSRRVAVCVSRTQFQKSRTFASASQDDAGKGFVHMADITAKSVTTRKAVARCRVELPAAVYDVLRKTADSPVDASTGAGGRPTVPKGDLFAVSQVAGVLAAKNTPSILPLCHPGLPIEAVDVRLKLSDRADVKEHHPGHIDVQTTVQVSGKTGVEMEALSACAAAALNVYDMCKPLSKGIRITDMELLSKSGGKSGDWVRGDA